MKPLGEACTLQKREPHFRMDRGPTHGVQTPTRNTSRAATVAGPDTLPADARSQIESERSRRGRKSTPKRHILTRHWLAWTAGAAGVTLGVVVMLWLTTPAMQPLAPGVAILANSNVSDATSLMAAVQTAGLRGSPDVKGAIEEIKRLDRERVTIKGWAVDIAASGSSLTIIAFASGIRVFTMMTSGARDDVAKSFGITDAGTNNISFQRTFICGPGEKLIVVAVTPDRMYGQFRSLTCP